MVKKIDFTPTGVCSSRIEVEVEEGIVRSIRFTGGCHGNTQGLSALAVGMRATEVVERLRGTDCKGRGTSCPDQLALALAEAVRGSAE
ncbi:MAG: TIGR03905 family TSCPD domain-containing protein [Rikenella sp.]|nr:TIGR03905 family TSCPD domain-containing protein [Rikenella sp.]